MGEYLVYRYVDVERQEVIYVGMGKGTRPYAHWKAWSSNQWLRNILSGMRSSGREPLIEIVRDCLSVHEAAQLEQALIAFYGRRCNCTGTLCNVSSGGVSAMQGVKLTPEQSKRRSVAIRAALSSPEARAKMSAAATKRMQDPAVVAKIKASRRRYEENKLAGKV